jgi:hypothetical protein
MTWILAVIFAGLWHRHAAGADEIQDKVPDDGECACAGADAAAVFIERHIAHIMQPVLDGPMIAR